MENQTKNYLIVKSEELHLQPFETVLYCKDEFLDEACKDIQNSPCPACGAENSMSPYFYSLRNKMIGLKCKSCGFNPKVREDFISITNSIMDHKGYDAIIERFNQVMELVSLYKDPKHKEDILRKLRELKAFYEQQQ